MERTTLIDSIVEEIRDKVISGELKEGEMLASRDNLAKEMGEDRRGGALQVQGTLCGEHKWASCLKKNILFKENVRNKV